MPNWDHLLVHTITYALRDGVDNHGSPTFAAQTTCLGLFERNSKAVRVIGGEWVSADRIATSTELPIGTRVWPPGYATGDNNAALEIKEIVAVSSPLTGDQLYEVIL